MNEEGRLQCTNSEFDTLSRDLQQEFYTSIDAQV
jgi:hypothetical protein